MMNNMKAINLCFSVILSLFAASISAQNETTTDKLFLSKATLDPGSSPATEGYITVSLEGSRQYATFGADIYLPDGYEWQKDEYGEYGYISTDGTMFNVGRGGTVTTHAFACNPQTDGALRVTIYPTGNGDMDFKANSGALFEIYIKATPYAKPGIANIAIKNCYFSTSAAIQYDAADVVDNNVSASTSCTFSVNISEEKKWATSVFPFSTSSTPEGLKVFKFKSVDIDNSAIIVSRQYEIEAYVPYILCAETGFSEILSGQSDSIEYDMRVANGCCRDSIMVGAVTPQKITEGYVLQKHEFDQESKFYKIDEGVFSIPIGKCYIEPSSLPIQLPSFLSIGFGDGSTSLQGIEGETSSECYDLNGNRVSTKDQHGILIINGNKVYKK